MLSQRRLWIRPSSSSATQDTVWKMAPDCWPCSSASCTQTSDTFASSINLNFCHLEILKTIPSCGRKCWTSILCRQKSYLSTKFSGCAESHWFFYQWGVCMAEEDIVKLIIDDEAGQRLKHFLLLFLCSSLTFLALYCLLLSVMPCCFIYLAYWFLFLNHHQFCSWLEKNIYWSRNHESDSRMGSNFTPACRI